MSNTKQWFHKKGNNSLCLLGVRVSGFYRQFRIQSFKNFEFPWYHEVTPRGKSRETRRSRRSRDINVRTARFTWKFMNSPNQFSRAPRTKSVFFEEKYSRERRTLKDRPRIAIDALLCTWITQFRDGATSSGHPPSYVRKQSIRRRFTSWILSRARARFTFFAGYIRAVKLP